MIVSIGGGSGHSAILSAIKNIDEIIAIVAITDDGGSSGKIKRELRIPAPGDIRNCIIALAQEEEIMSELMQHRFTKGSLSNHTVGNIIIAGLAEIFGDFSQAVEITSKILNIKGKVLPTYPDILNLGAEFEDGKVVWGESHIREYGKRIQRLLIDRQATAQENVLQYLNQADLIIIGPGSLYTSIITNFLVIGITEAILKSKAKVVYIQNLFTEPGETDGYSLSSHLNVLNNYFPISRIDYVLVNNGYPPQEIASRYGRCGRKLVKDDLNKTSFKIIRDNFIHISNNVVRHSPLKISIWIKKILENSL